MPGEPVALASLGLAGDGDEADVVRDLESAFRVDFGGRSEMWATVGDIEADLLALYPVAEAAGACGSAMAFRLLRSLRPRAAHRVRPSDKLADVVSAVTARRMAEDGRAQGLVVSAVKLGRAGDVGWLIGLGGFSLLAASLMLGTGWSPAALVAVGVAMISFDHGAPRDATLSEVSREMAAMNFAWFADRGANRRGTAVWDALCRILALTACVPPRAIGRTTRLFD